MTKKQMYNMIEQLKAETEYYHIGLRFEDKKRNVGEIITDRSRHNADREDERDFPEFGTEEYEEAPELDGVSAWDIVNSDDSYRYTDADEAAEKGYLTYHAYVVASDNLDNHPDPDVNEIVLQNAKVVAKLF